ncbi:hypothetical protein D3C71_1579380 [compost metagenome]
MAPVVVIGSAKGWHVLKSPFPKVLPEFRVISGLMAYIMITRKNTIWNTCILEYLHIPIGFFPFIFLIGFVHYISGMNYIFQVQIILIVGNPLYIFLINIRVALRIILRIRHPYKRKIIGILRNCRCSLSRGRNLILNHDSNAISASEFSNSHRRFQFKILSTSNQMIQLYPLLFSRTPRVETYFTTWK